MIQHKEKIRVCYAETDRMGYLYYGNYPKYFEIARVELIRQLGMSYKMIEDSGIILPVLDLNIKYIRPAFYDDLLTITTTVEEKPGIRIKFNYEVSNEEELLTKASTTLVFVDAKDKKPCLPPQEIAELFSKHFN